MILNVTPDRMQYQQSRFLDLKIMLVVAFCFWCSQFEVFAQQDPGFTQYMYNTTLINPAYAGSKGSVGFVMMSRQQWIGFDGAPQTHAFSFNAPLYREFVGIGLSYVKDKIGPVNTDRASADYAFRVRLHETGFLSFGIKTGAEAVFTGAGALKPLDPNISDPVYVNQDLRKILVSFGTGLFYHNNRLYLGLSAPSIRSFLISEEQQGLIDNIGKRQHFYLTGGYVLDVSRYWKLKPSFLVKHIMNTPFSIDLNINTMFRETLVAGVSHRLNDSFGCMVQLRLLSELWVGYAYDFGISGLSLHNRGTHEVLISYDLFRQKPETLESPRFF
jgi:type IX secretion system PorP/SprF family membrane protein